jgi:uncharacterized membrane protein YgdD (TMEM256/DUF423 family)
MSNPRAVRLAALMGFLAVALGAFGAHGLKAVLTQHGKVAVWEKAVFYHLIHAVVLLVLAHRPPFRPGPWWCFFAGIVLFSGSLYLLALTNVPAIGLVTPLGGLSLLAGWAWWGLGAGRNREP